MRVAARAVAQGSKAGRAAGWQHGYRLGQCEAIMRGTENAGFAFFDMHVAFVGEGLFALNEGIVSALNVMVRQLSVFDPLQCTAEQIAALAPDLVLVLNGIHAFPLQQMAALRERGLRTAVWFADDPYYTDDTAAIAPHYDYVFTHEMATVPLYRELGCPRVHYLPLAASRTVFRPKLVDASYRYDIVFIGTAFWNRVRFFDKIAPYLSRRRFLLAGGLWDRLHRYEQLKSSIRLPGIPMEETPNYYNGAKIVINLHRSHDDADHNRNGRNIAGVSINPRTFEINACATLQLTDVREDLASFYAPGREIETFGSAEELIGKIDYFLKHEDHRRTIAVNGMRRTMQDHTYKHRLAAMLTAMAASG